MKYGYFDELNREYVITRPDTPEPWVNYLGSPEYGAIISNNAGGYSFKQSGAEGRIIRYVFNHLDEPGRYIYLRDQESGDFWSNTWMPVRKPLSEYEYECRHGMAYTKMTSRYSGIKTVTDYYVPMNAVYEVWRIQVTNESDRERTLMVTGFAEFTNTGNYENDQVNLQYSQFITRTFAGDNGIYQSVHGNLDSQAPDEMIDGKTAIYRFLNLTGADCTSYCGSRKDFLGNYHDYRDPQEIASGKLSNSLNYCENAVGAVAAEITLAPGESKTMAFLLGEQTPHTVRKIRKRYLDPVASVDAELEELKNYWVSAVSSFQIKTPCAEMNQMVNTWHAFNCYMTFIWSRAASFIYCGLRNGYGYRDTVQDIQGVIHLAPEMAADKIRFMISAQTACGGGLPLVKFTHNAGHEDTPDDESYVKATGHPAYRADDALWLFPTIYKYIAETGNMAFIDEVIPYADHDEDTIYEHLKRALRFSDERLGVHGMPVGLHADWNDCLRLGKKGESSFVAFQYYLGMRIMEEFAQYKKDDAYLPGLIEKKEQIKKVLTETCWDQDRFIRGFTEAGEVIGEKKAPEANMWLNPQSWAVISGAASKEQAEAAMNNVEQILNTDYGVMLMQPPYHAHAFDGALAVIYNPGAKENGAIFSQTQGWVILAESLLGHGNRAFKYYYENLPSAQNDRVETRRMEPYCYGQFTEGKDSPKFGSSHVHWLTGTASTMMVGVVEGILGFRPEIGGLRLAPSIPAEWDGFEVDKTFRGRKLHVTVKNPAHKESGFTAMTVNGVAFADNFIPEEALTDLTEIELFIS